MQREDEHKHSMNQESLQIQGRQDQDHQQYRRDNMKQYRIAQPPLLTFKPRRGDDHAHNAKMQKKVGGRVNASELRKGIKH